MLAHCMQDTSAHATHSAKRARDDRVSYIQASAHRVLPSVFLEQTRVSN